MGRELKLRVISGAVMAAAVLLATWFGGWAFLLLSVGIGLLAFHEWLAMSRARPSGSGGETMTVLLSGWAVMIATAILTFLELFLPALLLSAVAAIAAYLCGRSRPVPFWFAGALIYAGLAMVSLAAIRNGGAAGLYTILFVFAVVWSTDIMAYFVGRAIGGPKLAPSISPGKTWSGAIGGAFFGVVAALSLCLAYGGRPSPLLALLALVLSAVSQAGDLFESALKRRCGAKDSSHLIPGHGGVMDRVDGLVAAAAAMFVLAYCAMLFGAGDSVGAVLFRWSGLTALPPVHGV
ncbi:phosphatidate cytidylyltransferase [Martelella radicis]|uniref:Phosphatidate cytidylyltransferase n=1 Tax=Martelella radicis TaxID=1397476 RepID=A0A7W6P9F1_9HYPH|nr:phosphatidate cytidylyltransferase [Martelella radicis]MBB4121750.1 phosphatidate cytidylyltransferase [Martelella radicis]